MCELLDQFGGVGFRQVEILRRRQLFSIASINDAPNASTLTVAAGMIERDFVVTDDAIVKVRDVKRAVRAERNIHRAKPRVIAAQEIWFLLRHACGTALGEGVTVDAATHDVSKKTVASVFGRKLIVVIDSDSGDGGRTVRVRANVRAES